MRRTFLICPTRADLTDQRGGHIASPVAPGTNEVGEIQGTHRAPPTRDVPGVTPGVTFLRGKAILKFDMMRLRDCFRRRHSIDEVRCVETVLTCCKWIFELCGYG